MQPSIISDDKASDNWTTPKEIANERKPRKSSKSVNLFKETLKRSAPNLDLPVALRRLGVRYRETFENLIGLDTLPASLKPQL
jgi:hypothetical protein